MVEDNIVDSLYNRLDALLWENSDVLEEVTETCYQLLENLEPLNKFETELKEGKGKIVKEVVNQIRDAIEDAEDVINKYIVNIKKQNKFDYSTMLDEVKQELQDINTFITEINSFVIQLNKMKESISSEGSSRERAEAQERLKRFRRNVEEDDVVGLDDLTQVLVKQLVEGSEVLQVVSITGMGGSGKTTLAKKLYNHSRVKNHFHCCAWLHVSNQHEEVELEIRTSSDLNKVGDSGINVDEFLSEFLKKERFLIVMDGLWSTHVLDEIRNAVSHESNGSRILITTRIKKVGLQASPRTSPYCMPFFNMEQSWELFTRKVFQGENFPPELEGPGREIVKRCCGLPIVVSAIGALAACNEKIIGMWLKLVEDIDWHITHDKTDILDVLALSYNDLPLISKQCFLYLGVFPKNFEIPVRQLIQMWIAEGFLQHTDEGEGHLERLVDQSLVMVSSRRTDGGVKTCRIHDLYRLFCLSECKRDKFLELRTDTKMFSTSKSRRLSLHCETSLYISSNPPEDSSVHSLFFFGPHMYPFDTSHWEWLYESFSFIRVLNLGRVKIEAIPDSIEDLILLKYLKLETEDLKVIPPSIGNILNLHTVDLRYSFLNLLPAEIWKLRELRHVYVSGPVILSNLHSLDSLQRLENLQCLSTVALDENTDELFNKDMFNNIRKLGLWYKPNSTCSPAEALSNLRNLEHLQRLKIFGTSELPRSPQSFPPNLTKITLAQLKFLDYSTTTTLENLPELRILKLLGSEGSGDMKRFGFICSVNGFPKLQVLQMSRLQIAEWKLGEGAMQKLQNLTIKDCTYLTMLPNQLRSLNELREVQVLRPSEVLAENLRKLHVQDDCELVVHPPLESASSSSRDW